MSAIDVAIKFAAAINGRNVDVLSELMTEDHLFIDGLGETVKGREVMKKGWVGYYTMVPDYLVEITETFVSGDKVALFGKASGTYNSGGDLKPENHWEVPAAWRAVIEGSLVKEWRVYADNEPIRQIMRREGQLE